MSSARDILVSLAFLSRQRPHIPRRSLRLRTWAPVRPVEQRPIRHPANPVRPVVLRPLPRSTRVGHLSSPPVKFVRCSFLRYLRGRNADCEASEAIANVFIREVSDPCRHDRLRLC